jgi:hypothetical protein
MTLSVKKEMRNILKYQKEIKEINKVVKSKRKILNDSKSKTLEYLESSGLNIVDVGSHEIALKVRETAATLNKDFLTKTSAAFFDEKGFEDATDLGHELCEYVFRERTRQCKRKSYLSVKKNPAKKQKVKIQEVDIGDEDGDVTGESGAVQEDVDDEEDAEIESL